jgi:hypothetical protein
MRQDYSPFSNSPGNDGFGVMIRQTNKRTKKTSPLGGNPFNLVSSFCTANDPNVRLDRVVYCKIANKETLIIMKNLILAALVTTTIFSCSPSTKIEKSWVEPGAKVTRDSATKVMIIAMVKDETSRRVIEDELAKRIKSASVASYRLLTSEMIQAASDEALNNLITNEKCTHVLLMRLADVEKETSYVPGTTTAYYGGYGRYYGYGAAMYSTPGYYTTDKNYFIETTIYSVNPNKLLWTGTTKTVNPSKVDKAVNDIADAVTAKMKEDKFLK